MNLVREKSFIKDFDKVRLNESEFNKFITYLALLGSDMPLPKQARDHALLGKYAKYREFHIGSDMLVIYKIQDDIIYLARIGTHAQLFK
ncbi:type II toxin-antitoxin system YafQ family toxin [uncultured Helicobacter sp.]|uniref:type II toxin-antitoxin system RelE/ParE family toxin n=1 Tax=uncultured Helicobacter sp. TaxID=175537 RepID=UPI001C3C04E2|nr:type II toxin-antitoxin system YafQ family toxin [Candidatus Helicobacter avicola]